MVAVVSECTVILGGGVVGLSIAYELSTRGQQTAVIDANDFASQASWAGAGMLPPSNRDTAVHPFEHLEALSNQVHREWASRLLSETKIDNGYQACGGLYLARSNGEIASLTGAILEWNDRLIANQRITPAELLERFPMLAGCSETPQLGWQFLFRKPLSFTTRVTLRHC